MYIDNSAGRCDCVGIRQAPANPREMQVAFKPLAGSTNIVESYNTLRQYDDLSEEDALVSRHHDMQALRATLFDTSLRKTPRDPDTLDQLGKVLTQFVGTKFPASSVGPLAWTCPHGNRLARFGIDDRCYSARLNGMAAIGPSTQAVWIVVLSNKKDHDGKWLSDSSEFSLDSVADLVRVIEFSHRFFQSAQATARRHWGGDESEDWRGS